MKTPFARSFASTCPPNEGSARGPKTYCAGAQFCVNSESMLVLTEVPE